MAKKYVWYSPATDKTGKVLMEQLGCEGGVKKPTGDYDIICWGTKIKKDEIFKAGIKVYNNPNNIRKNRNKLSALEIMKAAKCNVAEFSNDPKAVGKKGLQFPIVGRTRFHQGGQGFWLCLTKSQIDNALNEGAEYFQAFIDIKDEYRLHVVDGEVIYAVKKVARKQEDLKDAYKEHWKDHVKSYAGKKEDIEVDEKTLELVVSRLARKEATGVDMVVRSNTRGWKFSRITLDKVNKDLAAEAVKSVKALGLDYGAVDCCIDQDGKVWIIECNTGPGLEGSPLEAWVKALKELIAEKKKVEPAKKEAVAKVADKVAKSNRREQLKGTASFMEGMIDSASDEELETLGNIWEKMGIKGK